MDCVFTRRPPCPGVRFYPSDEELFMYYLKRQVMGKKFPYQMMSDVDVYRYAPWDLPGMSCLKTRDLYWYFFCPRVKKYASGARAHRLTDFGYWKSTGTDRTVQYHGRPVGKIKTLVFHRGKPPGGDRTNWVMHEYRLEDQCLADKGIPQDSYVICKIYEKSGLGPKNGEHYGAPFVEEEWESDDDNNVPNDQEPLPQLENVVPVDDMNALHTPGDVAPSSTEPFTPSVTAAWTPSTTTEQTVAVTVQVPPSEPLVTDGLGQLVDDDCFDGLPDLDACGFIEMNDFSKSLQDLDWCAWELPDDLPILELDDLN